MPIVIKWQNELANHLGQYNDFSLVVGRTSGETSYRWFVKKRGRKIIGEYADSLIAAKIAAMNELANLIGDDVIADAGDNTWKSF